MAKYADLEPIVKQLTSVCVTDDGIGLGKQMGINYAMEVIAKARIVDAVEVTRCQNCGWWHRYKSGDLSRGVCDKYAVSKNENGFCDEPLLEERERF